MHRIYKMGAITAVMEKRTKRGARGGRVREIGDGRDVVATGIGGGGPESRG